MDSNAVAAGAAISLLSDTITFPRREITKLSEKIGQVKQVIEDLYREQA
jgi:hypothetical protein